VPGEAGPSLGTFTNLTTTSVTAEDTHGPLILSHHLTGFIAGIRQQPDVLGGHYPRVVSEVRVARTPLRRGSVDGAYVWLASGSPDGSPVQ